MVAQRPFFIGRPGWVRPRAWIWLFSSRRSTTACAGRIDVETDPLLELLGEFGIVGELERATRCGWSQCPFQMRRTEEGLTPSPWPSPARSQWVASCGGA